MTDPLSNDRQQGESPFSVQEPASMGVGATLRSIREARRISIGEVSQRLKFSTRQVEDLEAERWDRLPGGVSLRGFVRNYARYLEADVDSVLSLFEHQLGPAANGGVMTPSTVSGTVSIDNELPIGGEASHRSWGWFLIILALLLVAAFYAINRGWVPESWLIFDWLKALSNNE